MAAYDEGWTLDEVAATFDVGRTTVVEWVRLRRDTGGLAPRPRGGGTPPRVDLEVLAGVMADLPDGTRRELTALYNKRVSRAHRVHESSVYRALRREGFVFKKKSPAPRSKTVPSWRQSARTSSSG